MWGAVQIICIIYMSLILADFNFQADRQIFCPYSRVNLTMISSKGTLPSAFDSETAWGKIRP